MSKNAGFQLVPYQASPMVVGSLENAQSMTLVYQGAPFVVVSQAPGTRYAMDARSRLTEAVLTNQTSVLYNYDQMGNRTSVVTTPGPNGL